MFLKPLDDDSVRDLIAVEVNTPEVQWTETAIQELIRISEGYPYLVQVLIRHALQQATDSHITDKDVADDAERAIREYAASYFDRMRVTPTESEYLNAMASLERPCPGKQVAEILGGATSKYSRVRRSLIDKNVIYSPRLGEVEFAHPNFVKLLEYRPT